MLPFAVGQPQDAVRCPQQIMLFVGHRMGIPGIQLPHALVDLLVDGQVFQKAHFSEEPQQHDLLMLRNLRQVLDT